MKIIHNATLKPAANAKPLPPHSVGNSALKRLAEEALKPGTALEDVFDAIIERCDQLSKAGLMDAEYGARMRLVRAALPPPGSPTYLAMQAVVQECYEQVMGRGPLP